MAQRIEVYIDSQAAKRLQKLAREWSSNPSLGLSQSCHVLLDAVDSGEFVPKPKEVKKAKDKEESE